MYKLFFIAKNNMKKQKGDMITFFILTFIAAFLILDCVCATMGMGKILDERFSEVNGPHILLITGNTDEESECAEKAFENDHIIDYEASPILKANLDYKNKNEEEYSQFDFIFESYDEEPEYLNVGINPSNLKKNDIIIPLFLKNKYAVGDTMQIKVDKEVYDFNVAGFTETPYFTSTINLTIDYVYISDEMIDELTENHPDIIAELVLHKGVCDETEFGKNLTTQDIENEISGEYKKLITPYADENPAYDYLNYMSVNWQMMRGGSQFVPLIIMAIILLFAVLIFVIAVVIISFSIKNFIQRNMKNTGILEASGYTVSELRSALTVQIMSVAALGAIVGIILAVTTFSSFGDILSIVVGVTWNQPVNILAVFLTFTGILVTVFLVAAGVSSTYKKVSVLDALRGGIGTHNFRRNFFSFEKTPLPIAIVMSLKDTFGGLGRNIVIVLITVMLTISALVGFGLYENFARDAQNLVNFMGFEMGTASVIGDSDMGDELRDIEGVENVLGIYNVQPDVYFENEKSTIMTYVYDNPEYSTKTRIIEGRLPKSDNEVMLTSGAAKDLGVKVGDVVEIEVGSKKKDYLVVGLNQRVEQMGRTMIMSTEAAERITPEILMYNYYITAEEGVSFETLKSRIEDYAEEQNLDFDAMKCSDLGKNMDSILGTVTVSMKALCIAIAVITSIIVVFVEALVIRAKITREWRGMGISKALGMTSAGLISQIVLSNSPAIIAGVLIGILVSQPAGSKLCMIIFSLFEIRTVEFNLPFVWIAITTVVILTSAAITSALLGMRVRTLKPVEMITEE